MYLAGLQANALLEGLAEVLIGWHLIQHAEIAVEAISEAGDADGACYVGKVASARWFAKTVLPRAASRRSLVATETGALMDLPDAAVWRPAGVSDRICASLTLVRPVSIER